MKEKYLILLLQIIKGNGNIEPLLKMGLNYFQVAEYIDYAIKKRYISKKEKIFKLTEIGLKKLESLNKKVKRYNSEKWIGPYDQFKIKKINLEEIYIPKKIKKKYLP